MPRNFRPSFSWRDPRFTVRIVLGVLLAANMIAALIVFKPWGGSPEDLERQVADLRAQLRQRRTALERLKALTGKSEKARAEGDDFLAQFFLDRRSAYSALVSELGQAARTAGMKPKGDAFNDEVIEGSDSLGMLTITANYEGSYADLIEFINLMDRSPRLMIIDSLAAAPQQSGGMLNVSIKLHTFVRETGRVPAAMVGGTQ
jgi:type IV pilus assembly protein PilO